MKSGQKKALEALNEIRKELDDAERELLQEPFDDRNYKASLIIKALHMFVFHPQNGMIKCAEIIHKSAADLFEHKGSCH